MIKDAVKTKFFDEKKQSITLFVLYFFAVMSHFIVILFEAI